MYLGFFFLNLDYCLFSSPVKLVRITASKETYSGATLQNPTYSNFVLLSSHAMMLWVIMKESISLCPCYNYILGFFIWHFSHMSVAKARIVSDHICGTCEGLRKVSLSLSLIYRFSYFPSIFYSHNNIISIISIDYQKNRFFSDKKKLRFTNSSSLSETIYLVSVAAEIKFPNPKQVSWS